MCISGHRGLTAQFSGSCSSCRVEQCGRDGFSGHDSHFRRRSAPCRRIRRLSDSADEKCAHACLIIGIIRNFAYVAAIG